MELTIAEDVVLLLLDDEHGYIAGEGTLHYTLGGAVLAELAQTGRARLEAPAGFWKTATVHAVPSEASGDPILDDGYDALAKKPVGTLEALMMLSKDARARITDRLVERGFVSRKSKKFLGLIPSVTWPAADVAHETELRSKIGEVLNGATPDARTAAIISLISAAQQLTVLAQPGLSASQIQARATEIAEGNWGAESVKDAVDMTNVAIAAATTAAITAAVVSVVLVN